MWATILASLSWGAELCALIGMTAPALAIMGYLVRQRRRKAAGGERAPMDTKLLRPAGHGLMQRLDDALFSGLGEVLLLSLIGGFLGLLVSRLVPVLWGWLVREFTLAQLLRPPHGDRFVSVVLFASGLLGGEIWLLARCLRRARTILALRLGLRGEQAVGEALADPRIAVAGYRIFHDVPGDGEWNVNHVAVGPAGVFVLETKARSKRPGREGQAKHEVQFDGRTLRFPNWDDHETVRQAERNMEWVRKFLADFAPPGLEFQAIVVIPGWYVVSKGNYPVKAMNTTYLPTYLAGMKRRWEPDELKAVIRRLDERCRTLEF